MLDIGLVLTGIWFVVLFGGVWLQSKMHLKNGIKWVIAILIAIPSLYIISTLF
jgi:hypothetical protein